MRLLIVEDEPKVARALREGLAAEHFDVVTARTGEEGFFEASAASFDVILLDLMLPKVDGLEVLKTLRARGITTPVLVLTARDTVEERVLGLESGADDYLIKPFAFAELLARIRALLRRGRPEQVLRLKTGDLDMDLLTRQASRAGRALELTPREFDLLEYLLRHEGHPVSRAMLARDVWKEVVRATPLDNVIDVQMTRLRRKVDAEGRARLIHTLRGVGFVLKEGGA